MCPVLSSFSENAVVTKARAVYGRRLTERNYDELMRRRTVRDAADYLRQNTIYSAVLQDLPDNMVTRGYLESLLGADFYARLQRISAYGIKASNEFYKFYRLASEIRVLLLCLRFLAGGQMERAAAAVPDKVPMLHLKAANLFAVRSAGDLRGLLRRTPYDKILAPLLSGDGVPPDDFTCDIFACDVALNSYYYRTVFELLQRHTRGKVRQEATLIFDSRAELSNICTIYRMNRFYNADAAAIEAALLPTSERIPKSFYRKLIHSPPETLFETLRSSKYAVYPDRHDNALIEYEAARIRYALSRRAIRFSTNAPTVFAAFALLSEIEIENITNIIEGIHYKIPIDEMEKLLIF